MAGHSASETANATQRSDESSVYDKKVYPKPVERQRPWNEIDYSSQNGPKLRYIWCNDKNHPLEGQTLYLGGEVGSNGKIYFIPGHAPRVLQLDPSTDELLPVGPELPGKFKWLRGVVVGDVIYGLPCHADSVLRIHVPSLSITKMDIPYEQIFENEEIAKVHRHQEWKYHGGNFSSIDGCIYAIPQSATRVLKIDPANDSCTLLERDLPGRWKWYGGVVGLDGALYGVPHDSPHVLRIHPTEGVSLHGTYAEGGHKWHGASRSQDGTIVCVPANADSVLCIKSYTDRSEPTLYELGDGNLIKTGRHRNDKKYKYLGAMTGTDGNVYVFPSGSERVLQVNTAEEKARNVGANIFDQKLETMCQNKWQNGVVAVKERAVYGIPLAAETLLRIDCSHSSPRITTWPLPSPFKGLAKYEGAVVAPNGVIYTVPNNHKAVLRIEPFDNSKREDSQARDSVVYRSGIPTLRSSAHRVKCAPKNRKHDPRPLNRQGKETKTPWLPSEICKEYVFDYDVDKYDLVGAVCTLLSKCDSEIVGDFRNGVLRLEDFTVPVSSTWRSVNGGQCESAQKYLSDQVANETVFLELFDRFVQGAVLPDLKKRLVDIGVATDTEGSVRFYYQRPPTLRIQPGPGWAHVKPHNDAEYGHQNGELNFWVPLTDRNLSKVDLWCESEFGASDYHTIPANVAQAIAFHGSSCRHYVNCNSTPYSRVSFDFRVGVEGYFDTRWQMVGTTDDHGRKEVDV